MELTLNGARINYERAGAGLPIIFLHAGLADSRMWAAQADDFARDFDVIRPDTRGFGRSEMPPGRWSAESDLLALIDALGLKPAHLIGCSMGGSIAIDFALLHPERISKLVLVGASFGGHQPHPEDTKLIARVAAARAAKDYEALNDAMLELFLDGPHRRPGHVAKPIRELVHEMNERAVRVDFERSPVDELDPPAAERLGEISAPTLVVVGDEDVRTVLEGADFLASHIPNARKAVIHNAAHLPNMEHPEEFNRLVLAFLGDD
jgi:pimeloyl-ACP methyl ester carboxylesterase